jgi:hypothetical protein
MVDENTVRQVALGAARTLQGGELRASRLQDDATLAEDEGRECGYGLVSGCGEFVADQRWQV